MYDYLVVGAGPFGCVFAHEMSKRGRSVLVVEKRKHIGGNCYTWDRNGLHIHKYGVHIFHTKSREIWGYINQFAKFNNYVHKAMVNYKDRIYSFPINLMTIHQLWPEITSPQQAREKLNSVRKDISDPKNFEEWVLSQVGSMIYSKFYYGYTMKQWGRDPKEVPINVAKRLPIRLNYDNRYFGDDYQGIPVGGYTQIWKKMLEGSEVLRACDFFEDRSRLCGLAKRVVFTGRPDELHDYKYGFFEYRSLSFQEHV